MQKLLIATHNPAKLREFKHFLSDIAVELVSLNDIGVIDEVEESGKTFEENAIKKAKYFQKVSLLPTIADDGGIEIDYFDGKPGVLSKRWITGKESTDDELVNYTLSKMINVPLNKRGANLHACVAFVPTSKIVITTMGVVRGVISEKESPALKRIGFPYRRIFYIPAIHKYYIEDELTTEEELEYNHRGKAIEKLKPSITQYFTSRHG